MASYAEGLERAARTRTRDSRAPVPAPTPRPRRSPEPRYYQYELNLPAIAEVWRHGSIIASRLLDLTAAALAKEARSSTASPGGSPDSGEGRWTVRGCDRRRRAGVRAERGALLALRIARPGGVSRTRSSRRCAWGSAGTWRSPDSRHGTGKPTWNVVTVMRSCCSVRPGTCVIARSFPALYQLVRRRLLSIPVVASRGPGLEARSNSPSA